jgi:hypothetical protein
MVAHDTESEFERFAHERVGRTVALTEAELILTRLCV